MSKFANICERNNAVGNLYWFCFPPTDNCSPIEAEETGLAGEIKQVIGATIFSLTVQLETNLHSEASQVSLPSQRSLAYRAASFKVNNVLTH